MKVNDSSCHQGYNPNTVIAVDWILYSRDFTADFPTDHVLNKRNSDSVLHIIQDVLAQNTGINTPAIATDVLLEQTPLKALFEKLCSNWKPSVIKNILLGYCSPSSKQDKLVAAGSGGLTLSNCSIYKGVYCAVDVFYALGRAPVICGSKISKPVVGTSSSCHEQPMCEANAIMTGTKHCSAGFGQHKQQTYGANAIIASSKHCSASPGQHEQQMYAANAIIASSKHCSASPGQHEQQMYGANAIIASSKHCSASPGQHEQQMYGANAIIASSKHCSASPGQHEQQMYGANAIIASSKHCSASPGQRYLANSTNASTSIIPFSDLKNHRDTKCDAAPQTNARLKKRKVDCCTSPLSVEKAHKRVKQNHQHNEVFGIAAPFCQYPNSILPLPTTLEKELILQELAYFASNEEQMTIANLRKEIQFSGGKSIVNHLATGDPECTNSGVVSKIPAVTLPCISLQKETSPTGISKKPETLSSLSKTSVQKVMQPSATRIINQHTLLPSSPPQRYTGPVSIRRLLAFLSVSVRRIVPLELFGSVANRTNFLKTVRAVLTAGRLDEVYLQQLMWKAKVTHCKWARKLGSSFNKSFMVAKMWLWLLQRIVLTIVQTFFYATESNKFNNMVVFYQKHIWCHLTDRALNELENKGSILLLKTNVLKGNPTVKKTRKPRCSNSTDGTKHSKLRFIPKSSGLRPIYPVKTAGANKLQLLKMRLLLNLISKHYEGGSVNIGNRGSLVDVWKDYNNKLQLDGIADSHLFVVKVDFTDAYGSVLHNVLLDVIDHFVETLPLIVTFGVYSVVNRKGRHGKKRHYILLDELGHPSEPIRKNGMPMEQINIPIQVNTRSIAETVRSYVKYQYISAGINKKYLVTKGIAQGGTISSTLCELYYNAMYYTHWRTCAGPRDLVLHCVDDFLFISPNKRSAVRFLELSVKGVDEFNCVINPKKTLHNICDGGQPRPIRVPFCGITICSLSRQLMVSAALITSYPVRYTLKLNPGRQPGQFVAKRLNQVTLARLPDTVIHPAYTTVAGVLANVFRVGLMAGARLEALVTTLLCPRGAVNGRFLAYSVVAAGRLVWRQVNKLWGGKGAASPCTKDTVLVAYIEGVLSSLGLKRHVVLAGLSLSLRRLQRPIYTRMSPDQRHLMPGILTKKLIATATRPRGVPKLNS